LDEPFASLAVMELPGGPVGTDAGQRRHVEHPPKSAIVAFRPVQVPDDAAGIPWYRHQSCVICQLAGAAEGNPSPPVATKISAPRLHCREWRKSSRAPVPPKMPTTNIWPKPESSEPGGRAGVRFCPNDFSRPGHPIPYGSRNEDRRKRVRRCGIGHYWRRGRCCFQFAFPTFDRNRRASRTRAGSPRSRHGRESAPQVRSRRPLTRVNCRAG
jgi:hypothetical protein